MPRIKLTKSTIDTLPQASPRTIISILSPIRRVLSRKLEIAVAIGNHPAVLLGSQLYFGLGDDEYEISTGCSGSRYGWSAAGPSTSKCRPKRRSCSRANLTLTILFQRAQSPSFTVSTRITGPGLGGTIRCVTQRDQPIYQAVLTGFFAKHCLLGGLAISTTLCAALQRMIPAVHRVLITDGGMGRLHAIITMHKPRLGEGKRVVMLAMGQVNLLKLVVVVEDDINPENPRDVEWSLAARCRGYEDLIVVPGVKADRCDPTHEDLTVTKIGMVATTRPGDGELGSRSEFAKAPSTILDRVQREIDRY